MNSQANSRGMVAALVIAGGILVPAKAPAQVAQENIPVITLAEARRRATSVDPDAVAARGEVATAVWG
ncbi:MAG: hypothetical protein M3125_01275, partial [Gemmatimonadota bacterium]|nr:hypothetical protein [Gemmatimonadota bacterium]